MNTITPTVLISDKRNHIESFDSLYSMAKYAVANKSPESSEMNDYSFTQTDSLVDAGDLALHGWNECRPDVDTLLSDLQDRINDVMSDNYVVHHDVAGAEVNMGLFMSGEPECMMQFVSEPEARMGRVVKVLINGVTNASTPKENIIKRGVAVLALVNTLHLMGVGIELWFESSITGTDDKTYSTTCKLHDSNQPLDIDNVMFALAHPSMLRRLVFSVQEQSKFQRQQRATRGGGYGSCAPLALNKVMDFDVTVERLQYTDSIVTSPLEWIVDKVTGLGLTDPNN